ncbi:uncharacterized protein LOC6599200 isoform X3 [Drosophila persimilis]|uniref:uncharacterized protein LOC6599200 isoform X3 n=1 Tax=Drosophila persimilis TaxID=7234 RepID=UPI000F073637|nr:uncharacterized protein LOC6599200 isoform X3 [Drosophila persimilis]
MSEKKSTRPEEKPQPETFYAGRGSRQIGKREDPTEPPTPLLPPTPEEKFLKRQAPREPKPAPKNDDEQPASTLTRPRVGSSRVGSSVLIGAPDELLEAYEQAVLEAEAEEESQQSENERRKLSPLSTLEAVRDGLLFIFGKFLRLVRRLDMHGGGTGNNINFVEGLIDFLAGSLGGAAQVYVSQPLDTVKVKLQTFPEAYKGMFDCFVSTYRKDGIFRGLYAGSLPAVVANVAENSVLFAAYGGCQKFVAFMVNKETTSQLTTTQNACAGSLAACFSTLTLQALREMKHYIEPSHPQDMRTPWSLTRYIWRTEAIKQFLSIIQNSLPMFLGACNISPSASTPTNPQSNQNQNDVDVDAGSTPQPQHPDSDGFSSSHHRTPPSPPPISPGGAGAGPARATPAAQPLASQSNVQRRGEQHHAAEQQRGPGYAHEVPPVVDRSHVLQVREYGEQPEVQQPGARLAGGVSPEQQQQCGECGGGCCRGGECGQRSVRSAGPGHELEIECVEQLSPQHPAAKQSLPSHLRHSVGQGAEPAGAGPGPGAGTAGKGCIGGAPAGARTRQPAGHAATPVGGGHAQHAERAAGRAGARPDHLRGPEPHGQLCGVVAATAALQPSASRHAANGLAGPHTEHGQHGRGQQSVVPLLADAAPEPRQSRASPPALYGGAAPNSGRLKCRRPAPPAGRPHRPSADGTEQSPAGHSRPVPPPGRVGGGSGPESAHGPQLWGLPPGGIEQLPSGRTTAACAAVGQSSCLESVYHPFPAYY